ncbi:MAG: hypothetical protein K6G25_00325 [Bacteroidales bacterium]|nr:hypothetical protein [Bacteroidales bacterium]
MTSSMIKRTMMVMLAVFSFGFASAQDVHYYKLTRKQENGKSFTNVSGGQFITFMSDICYESNKKGIGVGHGKMTRNRAYSNSQYSVYQGSSYWGKDATFKFNADKSVLNVVLENGDVYIYKRTAAPSGQETCSLIRKSGGESGDYTSIPIYPPQPNPVQSPVPSVVPSSTPNSIPSPSSDSRHGSSIKEETCPACHGTKTCETCLGRGWRNNPFTNQHDTCPICRGRKTCQTCNGSGKVSKTVYY